MRYGANYWLLCFSAVFLAREGDERRTEVAMGGGLSHYKLVSANEFGQNQGGWAVRTRSRVVGGQNTDVAAAVVVLHI